MDCAGLLMGIVGCVFSMLLGSQIFRQVEIWQKEILRYVCDLSRWSSTPCSFLRLATGRAADFIASVQVTNELGTGTLILPAELECILIPGM